jgi:hypothetical protein
VPAPVGVTYAIEESSVTLSWDQIEIATEYHIERATDSLFATNLIEFESETNTFTDNGLEADIDYYYRISAVCCDGDFVSTNSDVVSIMLTVMDVASADNLPESFSLHQNFPNPFNPVTSIHFDIALNGYVSLKIYDILGNHITDLVSDYYTVGHYTVNWAGINKFGNDVESGVYIYQLQHSKGVMTKKMVLLR